MCQLEKAAFHTWDPMGVNPKKDEKRIGDWWYLSIKYDQPSSAICGSYARIFELREIRCQHQVTVDSSGKTALGIRQVVLSQGDPRIASHAIC